MRVIAVYSIKGGVGKTATAVNLATVDTVVDAIQAKTDQLTFTVANQVDANAKSIGDSAPVHTAGKMWALDGSGNAIAPASDSAIRILLVSVDIRTVSPGFTPPQSIAFMAPRIIWIGLEGPGT